ncbi:hypothetical protein ACFSL4_01825 [Streptomyces caeni]|uniref:Minor tail protein n=1 Tax=Streptomyces caeni TaxID=2307231 RepID=A0ABW4II54_9ACTN
MAQQSWPYATYNAGAVTDAEYEVLASRYSDDGVYGDPTDTAVVTAGVGLSVDVRAGVYASLRGHGWQSGTTATNLVISANASGSTRTDRVVLRLDRATWTVAAVVREGTAGAGAPALVQDVGTYSSGVYEIPLATVTVPDSATSVTVTRGEQYVGARVRPCTSTTLPPSPLPGEQAYETDTGILRMWTGSIWVTVYEDSGQLTLGSGFSTWADAGGNVGRLIGSVVTLRIARTRIGSPLYVDDPDGSKVATVPAALRPVTPNQFFAVQFSGGQSGRAEVRTSGEVWVRALSGTVPVNGSLFLTMTYVRW